MTTPTQPAAPGRRFNTPPGWPVSPPGWEPEPGWQPDPSWGPAPEGWQWWLPAEPGAPPAMPLSATMAEPQQTAQHGAAWAKARNYYLAGTVVAVAAGVTTLVAAKKGGTVWTGGFLFGALLWFRAGRSTLALRRSGSKPSRAAITLVAVTAPLTLVLAGIALVDLAHMHQERPTSSDPDRNSVGSCWSTRGSEKVLHVACSADDATLIVSAKVTDPQQCATGYLPRTGYYLCLTPR